MSKILPDTRSQDSPVAWRRRRNKISNDVGLATGTIISVVEEFKSELGAPAAESLRVLGRELNKLGISAPLSAQDARIINAMQRLSLNEDSFESFIKDFTTSKSPQD